MDEAKKVKKPIVARVADKAAVARQKAALKEADKAAARKPFLAPQDPRDTGSHTAPTPPFAPVPVHSEVQGEPVVVGSTANLRSEGNVLKWDAAHRATGYAVRIGRKWADEADSEVIVTGTEHGPVATGAEYMVKPFRGTPEVDAVYGPTAGPVRAVSALPSEEKKG